MIEELRTEVRDCFECNVMREAPLGATPFSGDGTSGVMMILRNPGELEHIERLPAVGRVQNKVDDVLTRMGLNRQNTIITNVLNCYTCIPRANRAPTPDEIKFCSDLHLMPLLQVAKPKLVIAFGSDATRFMSSGVLKTVRNMSGTFQEVLIADIRTFVFYSEHPAITLHDPRMIPIWERDVNLLCKGWQMLQASGSPIQTPVF